MIIKDFLKAIHKMVREHGSGYTIKYMKACHVALQRVAGGLPLTSLRAIELSLALPRLNHMGIPPCLMAQGHMWFQKAYEPWLYQIPIEWDSD